MKLSTNGGVSHHYGGVLTSLKRYRAIWGIAAIYRNIPRYGATKVLETAFENWNREGFFEGILQWVLEGEGVLRRVLWRRHLELPFSAVPL